jgi:hypothetical protein
VPDDGADPARHPAAATHLPGSSMPADMLLGAGEEMARAKK